MAIDFSEFAFPKSRPVALDKADKVKDIAKVDASESAKAKVRAGGRCEVRLVVSAVSRKSVAARCERQDFETHHLIGGNGKRNKGKSILADYKLRVCPNCHALITSKILRPTAAEHDAHTVKYWRAK